MTQFSQSRAPKHFVSLLAQFPLLHLTKLYSSSTIQVNIFFYVKSLTLWKKLVTPIVL